MSSEKVSRDLEIGFASTRRRNLKRLEVLSRLRGSMTREDCAARFHYGCGAGVAEGRGDKSGRVWQHAFDAAIDYQVERR